ncbi:LysM peptidoglycan-binding domain-containing protein [Roseicyclus mahoneyensis]|uniref:Nucleoid-associated protein YgaU n=1 Tax=Roseicyclus mahoneyensis TaxID=164332 RepID=A0A316GPS5_9RHOB|nr:LysM peptidoglycan-binding domain-containing protein [Roseicyclus mahoneyensis]PWK62628.1 nucleoid-associated protein YgaU [Roseicyclus mahoneyensis]
MSDPKITEAAGSVSAITGAAVLGGLAVAAAVAFVILRDGPEAPGPVTSPVTVVDAGASDAAAPAAGEVAELPAPVATPETPQTPADPATPISPRFDLVRVDAAGSAVIAGQAASLAEVTLALDGEPVETVTADAAGQFVAMLALAPSERPRLLSLQAVLPDGAAVGGDETVLIAPFSGGAVATVTIEPALPPDPPPATRADPPGVGEVSSTAPQLGPMSGDADPAAAQASVLADAAPDSAPDPQTAPAATPQAQVAQNSVAPVAAPEPAVGGAALTAGAAAPGAQASAPQAPAILLADRDGVRVLQSFGAPPMAMTELRLDAITYDVTGEVTLAGRGPAEATVRVTLNNQPINLGEIGPGGQWSLDLPDVDPGTYTLRLDQVAPDGTVTRGPETPFLREDPARIRANPMLVDPGASVITVQRGFTLWGIAEANFGDGIRYVQIFEENRDRIRNPDLIFPGQIFALPDLPRSGTVP